MALESINLVKGVNYTFVPSDCFKTTYIAFNILTPLKKETAAANALAAALMKSETSEYPDLYSLNRKLASLYGAAAFSWASKSGDWQEITIGILVNDSRFSLDNEDTVTEAAKLLNDMVKGTIFATAQTEGAKPILTGINISVSGGVLQFVAIDGYRLAIRKEKVNIETEVNFTVSGKAIGEAVKLIDEESENVEINVGERLICFNVSGYTFISRLLEGDFVNYQKTLIEGHQQRVVVNTRELINTIERVSLLISESFSTPVRCYFNELNVVFTCATSMGRATETFNTKLEGPNFEIGLNSRYLLEAVKAVEAETVQILFNGPNAGVVILPLEGEEFKYMIMPMRLK